MIQFDYDELVKATESFSPSTLLGKGSHGSVYKAKLVNDNNKLVAVKKPFLHAGHNEEQFHHNDGSKLQNEIRVLSFLRKNRHVIGFLGTTSRGDGNNRREEDVLLVMEYMPNGSLHDLLHFSEAPPSWPKRVEIAVQVARAVRFLHDESRPSVVHRDIKSANVLFDCDFIAKLADFGLAVLVHVDDPGQPAGTIGYLDPCYTTPFKLSAKNDAFSFGVLVLEIVSGRKVIDLGREPAGIVEWALPLIRERRVAEICDPRVPLPQDDDDVAGAVRQLLFVAASCVSLDEECRPSMSDVVLGMEGCFLGRVRFPIWRVVVLVLGKRRRKLAKQWRERRESWQSQDCDRSPKGKVSLREVLAAT